MVSIKKKKKKIIVKNNKICKKNSVCEISPKTYLKTYIFDDITEKCRKKSKRKVKAEDFEIPEFQEFNNLVNKNYNVSQLKSISRHYNQKVSGNKNELIFNLYNYLKYSSFSLKIQKLYRGYIIRKFFLLHGPSVFNKKCLNDNDFLTFQKISDIPFYQLYTYKDKDNFIYGFDICSIYNMLKNNEYTKNPYNRNELPTNTLRNIKKIIRLTKKLGYPLNIEIKSDTEELSDEKKLELEALSVFQMIDGMGFITDSNWLINLSRNRCIMYIRELDDVWNYRAQLSLQTKQEIIPPNGRLFRNINFNQAFNNSSVLGLKKIILKTVKKLITKGVTPEARSLGCFYALGTFTIVSQSASNSLPWLYESFLVNH